MSKSLSVSFSFPKNVLCLTPSWPPYVAGRGRGRTAPWWSCWGRAHCILQGPPSLTRASARTHGCEGQGQRGRRRHQGLWGVGPSIGTGSHFLGSTTSTRFWCVSTGGPGSCRAQPVCGARCCLPYRRSLFPGVFSPPRWTSALSPKSVCLTHPGLSDAGSRKAAASTLTWSSDPGPCWNTQSPASSRCAESRGWGLFVCQNEGKTDN